MGRKFSFSQNCHIIHGAKFWGNACNIILGAKFCEKPALQCIDIFSCLCKKGAFRVTQVLQCNNKVKLEKKNYIL